jgi:dimethylamine corrinoid protein
MASEERTQEILLGLQEAVIEFDEDKTKELAQASIDEGVDPFRATMDGLAEGMIRVGDLYNRKEYFVSELLLCADALYAGLELLKPAIVASGRKSEAKGSIVLGVVEGDVHDIGKNLIKMMFDVAVYDL